MTALLYNIRLYAFSYAFLDLTEVGDGDLYNTIAGTLLALLANAVLLGVQKNDAIEPCTVATTITSKGNTHWFLCACDQMETDRLTVDCSLHM